MKEKLKEAVQKAVKKTINKFREDPYYFFTESDIHSYFYHCLYSSRFQLLKKGRKLYLIHREYPTNFRYNKKSMLTEGISHLSLEGKDGSRGHYDIAVINPDFVSKDESSIDDIINKNVKDAIRRMGKEELLFAIEFKYVIKNSANFIEEVARDNKKLVWSKEKDHAVYAINLAFCNQPETDYIKEIKELIQDADRSIAAVFIHSYYDDKNKKITPKPIYNIELKEYLK